MVMGESSCTCPVGFGQVVDAACPRHGNRHPAHTITGLESRDQLTEGARRQEQHIDAVEGVLRNRISGFTDDWFRRTAEACFAAADTGI